MAMERQQAEWEWVVLFTFRRSRAQELSERRV